MRRTKIASRELNSGAVVARSRQTCRDFGFPFRIARGLLHDKPFCAGVDPDSQHFGPQAFPCSFAVDSGGNARLLAGRSADDEMCADAGEGSHVAVDWNAGEMVGDEALSSRLNLDKLHDIEPAGGSEAEGVTADVAEKVEDIHNLLGCSVIYAVREKGSRCPRLVACRCAQEAT
jgi:hypothetical protein